MIFLIEMVKHTPLWVWGVLAYVCYASYTQTRSRAARPVASAGEGEACAAASKVIRTARMPSLTARMATALRHRSIRPRMTGEVTYG